MRKLISIGIIISLLVTFLVPLAVAAQTECDVCGVDAPCPAKPPAAGTCGTKSVGGALLWSLLSTTYIMGRAVGDVTETLAGTLGCWVDQLAVPVFGVIGVIATGLGGLLKGLGTLIGMEDLLNPIGDMLAGIEEIIADFLD